MVSGIFSHPDSLRRMASLIPIYPDRTNWLKAESKKRAARRQRDRKKRAHRRNVGGQHITFARQRILAKVAS